MTIEQHRQTAKELAVIRQRLVDEVGGIIERHAKEKLLEAIETLDIIRAQLLTVMLYEYPEQDTNDIYYPSMSSGKG